VWLSSNLSRLCWAAGEPRLNETGEVSGLDKLLMQIFPFVGVHSILTSDITKVTSEWPYANDNNSNSNNAGCCFTIVTSSRNLDLQAPSSQVRDMWITSIRLLFNIQA
jgi:hypothetical protein